MIGTIIVFILIPIVACAINAIEDANKSIPFDASFSDSGLPVITLTNDGKDFNFLIDTGANYCVLNAACLDNIKHEKLSGSGTMFGMEGNIQEVEYAKVNLEHGKTNFEVVFQVVNLEGAFGRVYNSYNIVLHGVLGTQFLEANKGRIDFIDHMLCYERTKTKKQNKAALKGQDE